MVELQVGEQPVQISVSGLGGYKASLVSVNQGADDSGEPGGQDFSQDLKKSNGPVRRTQ